MKLVDRLSHIRAYEPEKLVEAVARRQRAAQLSPGEKLLVLACDHPARGAFSAGAQAMAMANREEILQRCVRILDNPRVRGFLGTADLIDDLTALGALEGKFVWGSMNRGGLAGASFEMDDRFTGYDADGVAAARLDGGKMLVRIDKSDPGTVRTLEATGAAVNALATHGLQSMIEPFMSARDAKGNVVNDLTPEAVIQSIGIAQGLGASTARTWLKLPNVPDMGRVMESTSLPSLILGGAVSQDQAKTFKSWENTLQLPNVLGLVIGRSLLFPPDDDVSKAARELAKIV